MQGLLRTVSQEPYPSVPRALPTVETAPTRSQSTRDARGPLKLCFSHSVMSPGRGLWCGCHSREYLSASSSVCAITHAYSHPLCPHTAPSERVALADLSPIPQPQLIGPGGKNLTEAGPMGSLLGAYRERVTDCPY